MSVTIVVKAPGADVETFELPAGNDQLQAAQTLVGGFIEVALLTSNNANDLIVVFNEEGRLADPPLRANIILPHTIPGDILGNVFVSKMKGGEFVSLTTDEISHATALLTEFAI